MMDNTLMKIKENRITAHFNKQEVFKIMMASLLNPGELQCLKEYPIPFFKSRIAWALQPLLGLLHSEASFHIIARNPGLAELATRYLESCTGGSEEDYEDADFVLCLDGTSRGHFAHLKTEPEEQPYPNASIFYLVQNISPQPMVNAVPLKLIGSNFAEPKVIYIQGLDPWEVRSWTENRNENIQEADIYLISERGVLVRLPRLMELMD